MWHQEHPAEWKRCSRKEIEAAWFGFLGKQSRKQSPGAASLLGKVTSGSRRGKGSASGTEGEPVPECVVELTTAW